MRLAELQHTLFSWIADGQPPHGADALVHGGALSPEARVGIYAEMYWLRMQDVLRGDYPLLRAVVGDEGFDVLVAKLLEAHPSASPSLNRLGVAMPVVLCDQPVAGFPWLGDLAALEWARTEAFVAPDGPVLELNALAALDGESFAASRMTAVASLRCLHLAHDVLPAWRALTDGAAAPEVAARPTDVVVWRKGVEVFHVAVSAEEARALDAVRSGADLPTVCEAFSDAEDAAAAAFKAIGSWVGEGMVAALAIDPA